MRWLGVSIAWGGKYIRMRCGCREMRWFPVICVWASVPVSHYSWPVLCRTTASTPATRTPPSGETQCQPNINLDMIGKCWQKIEVNILIDSVWRLTLQIAVYTKSYVMTPHVLQIYHPVNRLRSFLLLGHSVTQSLFSTLTLTDGHTNNIRTYRSASQTNIKIKYLDIFWTFEQTLKTDE